MSSHAKAKNRVQVIMLSENKENKQPVLMITALLLIGLFAFFLFNTRLASGETQAQGGLVRLENFGQRVSVLSGEWDFYWHELLTKSDMENRSGEGIAAQIPGVWNSLKIGDEALPGYGYGTYHLKIKGLQAGQKVALYIPLLSVSYDVYADDERIASNGQVSANEADFKPSFLPQLAYFTAQSAETDIFVHSSNYIYARNGMWHSIYIGTPDQIEQLGRMVIYKDVFMLGAFLTLCIYYLTLYALRKDKQNLLFVLLCLGAAMRIIANGDRVIARLITDFPFELIIKFDYLAILLFYPILLFLMLRRFPKEFSKPVVITIFCIGAVFSLLVIVLPVGIFTQFVLAAEALLFATIIYTLVCLGVSVCRGRGSALQMFFSLLLLLVLTIHDAMYQSGAIESRIGEISAFGFFIFLMIESFAISRDYAENFRAVRELSQQLLESDKLKDRIRQTEMAFLQSQIKPHFLYNSLSVIDEYCLVDPNEASRLLNALAKYLRQSFSFENLESTISIETELALVQNYVDIECARFEFLSFQSRIDYQKTFALPPLTIQPLVENAIRHGVCRQSGSGKVTLQISKEGAAINISISDNGAGIPTEKLKNLLKGTGQSVGLINIHNRLLHMYGRGLNITSKEGVGTNVSFKIPIGGGV